MADQVNSVKEQIAADLQKAKSAGSTRVNRIWQIIQEAVSQTVDEVKAGTGEIGAIAKTSTVNAIENLKVTPAEKPEARMPVEVKIDDEEEILVEKIPEKASEASSNEASTAKWAIVDTPVTASPSSDIGTAQNDTAEHEVVAIVNTPASNQTDGESSSVASETDRSVADALKSLFENWKENFKNAEAYAALQQILAKLKEQFTVLDTKLANQYGERYESFKQEFQTDMAKARTWYEGAKAEAQATGSNWVEQKQAEVSVKMDEAGATIAQKEQKIKQLLREFWQTISKF